MGYKDSINQLALTLSFKNKSFLITGATGLVGSCIIDTLIEANKNGCNVTIYALSRSLKKIKDRFNDSVIPIIQDIITPISSEYKFDYIIHCASNADPKTYALHPSDTILTNILGNKSILDYCKDNNNTRLLMTSSFEIYGKIDNNSIFTENMSGIIDQTLLRNGYPESKRCSELLLRSYVDEFNINAVIARLSSVYGPTMLLNDSKAHAQFIKNAVNCEDIILKSLGEQIRSYTYVVDAVSAIFMVLLYGKIGDIYNVSNENSSLSIAELAKICAKISNTRVIYQLPNELELKGYSKPANCILNNEKLKKLGWTPKYTIEKGLKETIEYLKK